MIPGEMRVKPGDLQMNVDREQITLDVSNSGDRPVQIGSHYHFFEVNDALQFDRDKAYGFRLNIAPGCPV